MVVRVLWMVAKAFQVHFYMVVRIVRIVARVLFVCQGMAMVARIFWFVARSFWVVARTLLGGCQGVLCGY